MPFDGNNIERENFQHFHKTEKTKNILIVEML
jgi:hypothetical protein